jgi:hypothetical protein
MIWERKRVVPTRKNNGISYSFMLNFEDYSYDIEICIEVEYCKDKILITGASGIQCAVQCAIELHNVDLNLTG